VILPGVSPIEVFRRLRIIVRDGFALTSFGGTIVFRDSLSGFTGD